MPESVGKSNDMSKIIGAVVAAAAAGAAMFVMEFSWGSSESAGLHVFGRICAVVAAAAAISAMFVVEASWEMEVWNLAVTLA